MRVQGAEKADECVDDKPHAAQSGAMIRQNLIGRALVALALVLLAKAILEEQCLRARFPG